MEKIKEIKNLLEFIRNNDFVDIYIYKNKIIAKDFADTKQVATIEPEINIESIYKLCNYINKQSGVDLFIPTYTEYFAIYMKEKGNKLKGFRGTYGDSIDGEYINFRSLSSPRSLNNFIKDPYLIKFFTESFIKNNSVIISGPTGSGKTTLMVSFFDFINQYNPKKYEIEKKQEYFEKIKGLKIGLDKIEQQFEQLDIEEQNNFYYNLKKDFYYKMLVFIEKENKKIVYSIENPIEYYYKSNNLHFIQNDVLTHGNVLTYDKWIDNKYSKVNAIYRFFLKALSKLSEDKISIFKGNNIKQFQNLADKALRTNPEYLIIGEIKNPLEFDIFLRAISFGIPVYTTSHADDAFSMIQRIYDTSSFSELEKLGLIARGIYGIVNTRIFFFKSIGKAMSYFDLLFLDDYNIRTKLYNFLKIGDLHKFAEEMENSGIRSDGDKFKVYYINKKISLLFAILNIINENKLELENPNIKRKFDEEVRFLKDKYNFEKLDFIRLRQLYHIYVNDDNLFNSLEEYILDEL